MWQLNIPDDGQGPPEPTPARDARAAPSPLGQIAGHVDRAFLGITCPVPTRTVTNSRGVSLTRVALGPSEEMQLVEPVSESGRGQQLPWPRVGP